MTLRKYPRTPHLSGSRSQPGDEDLAAVPLEELSGRPLVVEEKLDGANSGIRWDRERGLLLQSRGHYLRGGRDERQFALLKTWASRHAGALRELLGERYVVYGEWLYAKHTIFYDALPHFFLEFDVLDLERGAFLSTPARRALLAGSPFRSVPVLHEGELAGLRALSQALPPTRYRSPAWAENLRAACAASGLDPERAARETDASPTAEGLYVKWEEEGVVRGRYKFVRASFHQAVLESGSHWQDRPLLPNGLAADAELFA